MRKIILKHNILREIAHSTINLQHIENLCLNEVLAIDVLQFNVL